jgi:hypothetical protein
VAAHFRAQLVLPEQTHLFDIWANLKGQSIAPNRSSITPSTLGSMIAFITVFDVNLCDQTLNSTVKTRIAGSALRGLLGFEPQGRILEAGASDAQMLGRDVIEAVARDGVPRCGTRAVAAASGGDAFQVWMRLPLLSADGKISAILGLDRALPMTTLRDSLQTTHRAFA